MDFFAYQKKAKRKSRLMILGVIVAVLLILVAVNFLVGIMLSAKMSGIGLSRGTIDGASMFVNLSNPNFWYSNIGNFQFTSFIVAGFMGVATASKMVSLRAGGGSVARQLGGDVVTIDNRDPLRRRLYNVVEEMSIASGVPVPEVYVLEHESGINAFAAGYTQTDAAIAVTRGALETFSRKELQGVVAHEFSHILNGDMRINIRLIGAVSAILIIYVMGKRLLFSRSRFGSRSYGGGDRKSASAAFAAGIGLMVIGSLGLLCARILKASISREREYLADASAIQFTRDPDGISNALKKIAASSGQSHLKVDAEEVSHMLFGSGQQLNFFSKLFATHPPLLNRIQRFEPYFNEHSLKRFTKKFHEDKISAHKKAQAEALEEEKNQSSSKKNIFEMGNILLDIGHPSLEQILMAGAISESLPPLIERSSHSLEWAPEVMLYSVLSSDESTRENQLLIIAKQMGEWSLQKVESLCVEPLAIEQRLPLMEMTFPQLKKRPIEELEVLLETIRLMIEEDHKIETFEYLVYKLIALHVRDSKDPSRVQTFGNSTLKRFKVHVLNLIGILACHGTDHDVEADKAFNDGMVSLGWDEKRVGVSKNWQRDIDIALERLNTLKAEEKKRLVVALAEVIMSDDKITIKEHEVLRAICAGLHIPLPVLA